MTITNEFVIWWLDYDWKLTENSTIVDIGGGNGGFLLELLNRYKTKGVIFDLPNVIEHTQRVHKKRFYLFCIPFHILISITIF